MTETFAYEVLVWGYNYTGFEAVAVTLGHARLVIEEELQALGLQDRALALAAYSTGKGSIAASAALQATVSEVHSINRAGAIAYEQWPRPDIPSETSAKPTQWNYLIIAGMVVYLDVLKRDNEAFYEWISKG